MIFVPRVLGIDPGARETGCISLAVGGLILSASIIRREEDDWAGYLLDIAQWFEEQNCDDALVGIESMTKPKAFFRGKQQMLPVDSIMGTCEVLGAVRMLAMTSRRDNKVIMVPPGKNGSGSRSTYPVALWGDREGDAGTGTRRHVRSAYDVALGALQIAGARLEGESKSVDQPEDRVLVGPEARERLAQVRRETGI